MLEDRLVPAVISVTTTADEVKPNDGLVSLREAISQANADTAADTIVLPAGLYQITIPGANEDLNATGDFDIRNDMTISGAGAASTIIDGNQLDRVFNVITPSTGVISVTFSGVTIRNGSTANTNELGGGIHATSRSVVLMLTDCVVTGNLSGAEMVSAFSTNPLLRRWSATAVPPLISTPRSGRRCGASCRSNSRRGPRSPSLRSRQRARQSRIRRS
jgi:CSLREA domain-containing protein